MLGRFPWTGRDVSQRIQWRQLPILLSVLQQNTGVRAGHIRFFFKLKKKNLCFPRYFLLGSQNATKTLIAFFKLFKESRVCFGFPYGIHSRHGLLDGKKLRKHSNVARSLSLYRLGFSSVQNENNAPISCANSHQECSSVLAPKSCVHNESRFC